LPPTSVQQDRASHEWNYLPPGNDWRRSQGFNRNAFVTQIRKMAADSEKEPSIQIHYTETIDAISRMADSGALRTGC